MTTDSATDDGWERLVSTALVGTGRRPVPELPDLPAPHSTEGAEALLDRAALAAVRRTAGYTPRTAVPVPPAEPDPTPEIGPRLADRLRAILADRFELLPEFLGLVAAEGLRVSHELLPGLLDRGARDGTLRPVIATVVGTRGLWLSGFRDSWSYVKQYTTAPTFVPRDWEQGDAHERRGALAALRNEDPTAARELLAEALPKEGRAEQRRRLLAVLETGLTGEDADVLVAALGDRSANVRGLALSLLTRLPDSDHADRLRGYVRALVGWDEHGHLRIDPPDPGHEGVRRDLALAAPRAGLDAKAERAERAERLWALITHAPLDVWATLVDPDPRNVFARVADSMRIRADDALINAVGVQRVPEWSRAVLASLAEDINRYREMAHPDRRAMQLEAILRPLPLSERCDWALRSLAHIASLSDAGEILRSVRGPWTPELSVRVARLLGEGTRHTVGSYGLVCDLAAEHMPPNHLIDLPPNPPVSGFENDRAHRRLRDTLRFRLDMHREF